MIAEHCNDRDRNVSKRGDGRVRFAHEPVVGDVAGKHQQIGAVANAPKEFPGSMLTLPEVQVSGRCNPDHRPRPFGYTPGTGMARAALVMQRVYSTCIAHRAAVVTANGRRPRMGQGRHGLGLNVTRRAFVAFGGVAVAARFRPVAAQGWTPYAAPKPPAISAKAAYVYDATSGTPLFAINEDARLAPASLTKIASALVVLEKGNLDDVVTIEDRDLVGDDESRVGLVAGDTLTVRDLLAGMLIPSGSDAAKALARHVGGQLPPAPSGDPMDAFIAGMNDEVAQLGLANSHFQNPHGLDGDNHMSSARDLAVITARAMQDPVFAEFVATSTLTLPSALNPEGYTIYTTNDLLVDGTAIGVKTGTTELAGGCLVTATTVGGNIIIFVVLGAELVYDENGYPKSPARYADTRDLIAAIDAEYDWLDPVSTAGLPEELAAWSATLPPGAAVPAPKSRLDQFGYRLVLGPAASPGAPVGRVMFTVGNEILSERQVVQL